MSQRPLHLSLHYAFTNGGPGPELIGQAQNVWAYLTNRQQEVATLMASGRSNKEIAEELGISSKTLDIHRTDVYARLQVSSPAGVAMIWLATQQGK